MAPRQCTDELEALLAPYAREVEADLVLWMVEPDTPPELAEAMEYCVLGGGKRLRPALVLLSAEAVGAPANDELTRRAAVAVELVHCYSLVHDDLPAMDNDTLRRGRPTAHVKFCEAMAILVGDALLSRAFGVLTECGDQKSNLLAAELARAAGSAGMIAGQAADMGLCRIPDGLEGLVFTNTRKTAALIRSAARMGAICAQADKPQLSAISEYAHSLGLAFQLADDLLDVVGSADKLGKTPGKDAQAGKRTYVEQVGLDQARCVAQELTDQAVEALQPFGPAGEKLTELATLLAERNR